MTFVTRFVLMAHEYAHSRQAALPPLLSPGEKVANPYPLPKLGVALTDTLLV